MNDLVDPQIGLQKCPSCYHDDNEILSQESKKFSEDNIEYIDVYITRKCIQCSEEWGHYL